MVLCNVQLLRSICLSAVTERNSVKNLMITSHVLFTSDTTTDTFLEDARVKEFLCASKGATYCRFIGAKNVW
jgi:hypothetical protein